MARLYLDEDVAISVADMLGRTGHNVLTTRDAGRSQATDVEQMELASREGRVLVSHNRKHFRKLHRQYQREGKSHCGVILLRRDDPVVLVAKIQAFLSRGNVGGGNFCESA